MEPGLGCASYLPFAFWLLPTDLGRRAGLRRLAMDAYKLECRVFLSSFVTVKAQFLEPYRRSIQELCEAHGVARLDVFGSVVRPDFNSESDVDFLVVFKRDEHTNAFAQYFELKEGLQALLLREVELVCAEALRNPYFKKEVEATREPLYAA